MADRSWTDYLNPFTYTNAIGQYLADPMPPPQEPGRSALGELMRSDQPYGAMQRQDMQDAQYIENRFRPPGDIRVRPNIDQGRNAITDSIMRRQRR